MRIVAFGVALLLMLIGSQPQCETALADLSVSPNSPEAIPVVEEMLAAYGGRAALLSIRTQVTVRRADVGGIPATVITMTKGPASFLFVVEAPSQGIRDVTGFNGTVAWTQDSKGVVRRLDTDQSLGKRVVCSAIAANYSALFSDRFHEVYRLKPDQVIGGKRYNVLSSQVNDCPEHDSYLDPETHLAAMVTFSDGVHTSVSVVRGLVRGPSGEPFPRVTTTVRAFGPPVVSTFVSAEDNVNLDDAIFDPPAPGRTQPTPASAFPVPIPRTRPQPP